MYIHTYAARVYGKFVYCNAAMSNLDKYGTFHKLRTQIRGIPRNSIADSREWLRSQPRIARALSAERSCCVPWNICAASAERLCSIRGTSVLHPQPVLRGLFTPRFRSNRQNGEGSPCYVHTKDWCHADGKTRSAIQPADKHNQMFNQLLSIEIKNQMHQGFQINSEPCHQDPNQCNCQRGASPIHLNSNDFQLHLE